MKKSKTNYEKLPNNESFIDINEIFVSYRSVHVPLIHYTNTALSSNTLKRKKNQSITNKLFFIIDLEFRSHDHLMVQKTLAGLKHIYLTRNIRSV